MDNDYSDEYIDVGRPPDLGGSPKYYDEYRQPIVNFTEWTSTSEGWRLWKEILVEHLTSKGEDLMEQQQYESYGNRNLITFQSKVNRGLFDVYDVCRRIQNKTRKESLEDYMRWMITEHQKDDKVLNEYLEVRKEVCGFIEE